MTLAGEDRARIAAAVRQAEANTSGEIVAVVAESSDDYRFIPLLWAALAALLAPFPLLWFSNLAAVHVQAGALLLFIILALLLSTRALRLRVTPRSVQRRAAHNAARAQFLARNLHVTEERTGVLVFVSVAEHYAEVIADHGVAQKVEPADWDHAIDLLIADARDGRLADGVVKAVEAVGAVLAVHAPPSVAARNELPDHVVEI